MRTLDEITTAVRRNQAISKTELFFAVCAYDVLLSKLQVEKNAVQLQEYFIASDCDPLKYIGEVNDPRNPEAVAWHKAFIGTTGNERPSCYGKKLDREACYHTCPVSDQCYGFVDEKGTPILTKNLSEITEYNYHKLNEKTSSEKR